MPGADLSSLPSVDRLLAEPRIVALIGEHSRSSVASLVRDAIQRARIAARGRTSGVPTLDHLVSRVVELAESRLSVWPRRLINATGVILHTNLGRAPMSELAILAGAEVAGGYSDLEFDISEGRRGSRNSRISDLIAEATGAEAGMVVNNNAAAVLLALAAIAGDGKEVIVSRGEAVEIGGGFRIPDVMRQTGARLIEVGTTNKTYVSDFQGALTERTAAALRVHPSNFTVSGFTHSPDLAELVDACRTRNVPVLNDLGSGSLIDTAKFGLGHEPLVQESIAAGAGLTMFSGDKLLGGPQAGIIAGKHELVELAARHPLARALRSDKVTLAALAATLSSYVRGVAESEIPVWRMIATDTGEVRLRATSWRDSFGYGEVIEAVSPIGGGSLPGQTLPTWVLSFDPPAGAHAFLKKLRTHEPFVIARIDNEKVILDPRTVMPAEDEAVVRALRQAMD